MAGSLFKISVDQSGQFGAPNLSDTQLRELGLAMVAMQKARWARGINVRDQVARPLAAVTAKAKITYGQPPIRNMYMTGLTSKNFTLRKSTANNIRAENTSTAGRMHARKAQKFEPMIGISPIERDALFALAYRAYGVYLKRAWTPTQQ